MAAAAAMAAASAATGFHIGRGGDFAEFKGFADVLGDGLLDFLHFFLGIQKAAGDGILEEGFAMFLKIIYFGVVQSQTGVAFLVENVPFGNQRVILATSGVIREEGFNLAAKGLDFRLVKDGLAEFPGFRCDGRFFSLSVHNCIGLPGAGATHQHPNTTQDTWKCKRNVRQPGTDGRRALQVPVDIRQFLRQFPTLR